MPQICSNVARKKEEKLTPKCLHFLPLTLFYINTLSKLHFPSVFVSVYVCVRVFVALHRQKQKAR